MGLGQGRGDGSLGDAEHLADLGVREIREVAQEDRRPPLRRKLPHGSSELGIRGFVDECHFRQLVYR